MVNRRDQGDWGRPLGWGRSGMNCGNEGEESCGRDLP